MRPAPASLLLVIVCVLLHGDSSINAKDVKAREATEQKLKPASSELIEVSKRFDKEKFNAIANNIVPVLKGITDALGKDGYNIQRFASVVSAIGPALGALGPIISLATSILGAFLGPQESAELQYMKAAFAKVFQEFSYLDNRISQLENAVEKINVYQAYKANFDKLRRVELMFKRFTQHPEKASETDLKTECANHNPKVTLDWIHQRVVNPRIEPRLLPTILTGTHYDIRKFDIWMKTIIGDAMAVSLLDQACLGVHPSKPTEALMKRDAATAQRKLREINSKLNEYQNNLKRNVAISGQMDRDIEGQMRRGGDYAAKATNLFQALANKYTWLLWSALVFNQKRGISIRYYNTNRVTNFPGIWFRWKWYDVNTVIMWSLKTTRMNPGQYTDSRVCGEIGGEGDPKKAVDKIIARFGRDGVRYTAVAAVKSGAGWNIHYHTNGHVKILRCRGVHVFILHHW